MFDKNLAIVDLETTGMSAKRHRVIEIAVIRIEGNKVVDTFSSCINPQIPIPWFITHLTGISDEDVAKAPLFSEIKQKVRKILKGTTFVAHNAWFDYSFMRSEFERMDIPFESKRCCTVRLSRRLFPQYKSHSLESIIKRYGFSYKARHRAYDDAHIVWQFLKKIKKEIPEPRVRATWKLLAQVPES